VRRNFLLIASVIAALAFLARLVWITPEGSRETRTGSAVISSAARSAPAAIASGFAGAPVSAAPESRRAQSLQPDPATPTAAPLEVQEATDRRQSAKITRGMSSNPQGGIRIDAALPGSVAGQMNLLPGDVLTAVNGTPVSSPEEFARIYRTQGIQGEFVVIRGGREIHRR
jgi:S1-C subfamily serine protease